jgi:hypothetical protein
MILTGQARDRCLPKATVRMATGQHKTQQIENNGVGERGGG